MLRIPAVAITGWLLVAAATFPTTLTDDGGTRLTIKSRPERIVSLTPANTEMLFAIGAGDRLVGDTTACDYPPAALKIAKIGGFIPNYERVVSLKPDLVVTDDIALRAAGPRLRALGEPVLGTRPTTIEAIEADLRLLGQATGCERGATAAVSHMESEMRAADAIVRADPRRPRVLAVIGIDPLWVAGRGTFIDDAIRRAGAVNSTSGVTGFVEYSEETVLTTPPDAIIASKADQRTLLTLPSLQAVPAIRNRRLVTLDPGLMERPGPRLAEGVLQLAQALHAVHNPGR